MDRRKAWVAILATVLATGGLASLVWHEKAEHDCLEVERSSADLFDRRELVESLLLLDEVDARCDCARFTSGDEPPQISIARTCLRELRREGRANEAREVLSRAKGPILKDCARLDGGD